MPTITIRNGKRCLKLTKREVALLEAASDLVLDINCDYVNGLDDERWKRIDDLRSEVNWMVSMNNVPISAKDFIDADDTPNGKPETK